MATRRRKKRGGPFVLGKDFRSDGHVRITKGDDFLVEGGTKITHEETSAIVEEFSKRLRKEKSAPPEVAKEILRDVLQQFRRRN